MFPHMSLLPLFTYQWFQNAVIATSLRKWFQNFGYCYFSSAKCIIPNFRYCKFHLSGNPTLTLIVNFHLWRGWGLRILPLFFCQVISSCACCKHSLVSCFHACRYFHFPLFKSFRICGYRSSSVRFNQIVLPLFTREVVPDLCLLKIVPI